MGELLMQVRSVSGGEGDLEVLKERILNQIHAALALPALSQRYPMPESIDYHKALRYLLMGPGEESSLQGGDPDIWATLLIYLLTRDLGRVYTWEGKDGMDAADLSRTWIDEWLLGKIIVETLINLGMSSGDAWERVRLIKLLIGHQEWCQAEAENVHGVHKMLRTWLNDSDLQGYLRVNRYQDVLWYNKEAFEQWLWWAYVSRAVDILAEEEEKPQEALLRCYKVVKILQAAEENSDYKIERLLEAVQGA